MAAACFTPAILVQRPASAVSARPSSAPVPARCTRTVVRCSLSEPDSQVAIGRRNLVSFAAILAPALAANPAFALIPDDDDQELLKSTQARRQERLEKERATERRFANESGKNLQNSAEIQRAYLQLAVKELQKAGNALKNNDFTTLAGLADGDWLENCERSLGMLAASTGSESAAKSSDAFSLAMDNLLKAGGCAHGTWSWWGHGCHAGVASCHAGMPPILPVEEGKGVENLGAGAVGS
eukprot:jgi/Mesvir1/5117/Mv15274-RA.2